MNALQSNKGKKQRNRNGPSNFYYEDENRINLDYAYIQKFGQLEISPPTEFDQLTDTNKLLVTLRDALRIKGQLQQIEGRSKFTRNKALLEEPAYTDLKNLWDNEVSAETQSTVKKIQALMAFNRQQSNDEVEIVNGEEAANQRPRRRDDGGDNNRNGR